MQSPLRLGLTLMLLCAVAAGLLAFTNAQTATIIAENEQAKLEASLKELLPEAERFETTEEDGKVFYQGFNGDKQVGVVAVFEQKGFGGFMTLMLGVNNESKITGFRVLAHSETPGLGARITEDSFMSQFEGKSTDDSLQVGKDIQAISGATISTRSVAGGIKLMAGEIEKRFMAQEETTVDLALVPDGEYQGEAEGFAGNVKVTVKVSGGKITEITAAAPDETPEIGGPALPTLIKRVIESQDLDVDAVSGATFTSEGFKQALKNALAQFATGGAPDPVDLSQVPDGTYKGTAEGFAGDITVEVTVEGGKITDLKYQVPDETPDIGGVAVKQMAEKVKSEQRLDVDVVSGATFSSQGFLDALQAALR
ncbi:MAG: RnfABCDGE type electron transport complex subunit G [Firmicutes bacterium]|nr:RnfABCDGE type electron transport complex subunit G [Bacillota bacterium]